MEQNPFNRDEFYEQLVRDHYDYVCKVIMLQTDDREKTQDVVQETFLQAWIDMDKISVHENTAGWLIITAKYKLQHQNRENLRQDRIADEIKQNRKQSANTELYTQMRELTSSLGKTDKKIVDLYYFENLKMAEIAVTLGMSEDAVKKRHERIKMKLARKAAGNNFFKKFLEKCHLLLFFWNI